MSGESYFLRLFALLLGKKTTILYEMHILFTVDHFNINVGRNGLENTAGAFILFHIQYNLRSLHRAFFFFLPQICILAAYE